MLDLVFRNYTFQKTPGRIFFKKIIGTVVRELKINNNFSISVNLVGEKKIKELNKKYLNRKNPTDVLSFPVDGNLKLKTEKDIGDVFICLSIAKNEAKRENITIKEKLARLTIHGFLHLIGYDHEKSKRDSAKMFNLERKLLDKIKF
jgi:probable rRNA maturation factor